MKNTICAARLAIPASAATQATALAALLCLALFALLYAADVASLIAWRTDSLFLLDSYKSRLTD